MSAALESQVLALCAGEADPAFRRRAAWALARLQPPAGARVVEIGMGSGALLLLLQRLAVIRPVGVEIDLGRICLARRCGYRDPAVVADAGRLPFRDGVFACGLACEVLEHLADDEGALAELRRVIAPGGRAAVTVPHAHYPVSWDPLAFVLERLGIQPPRRGLYVGIWYGHRRLYLTDQLTDLVAAAGWKLAELAPLVRGAFPFAHFLLYGVGKRLLEAGLIRQRAAAAVGRLASPGTPLSSWRPLGLAIRVLRWFDERAERHPTSRRSVHLGLLLTNPADG